VTKSTGGSSGVPLRFQIESDAIDRRVAATFRGYGWAGAGPGTRQSHLWGVQLGSVSRLQQWKTRLHLRGLYRSDYLNSFDLSDSTFSQFVSRINRYRPDILVAYTNPLYSLSRMIADRQAFVHRPKSIIVGAEKLYDFQRQEMERVFGAPVFETYGSREFTLIGAECDRHNGLHLTSENLIVEVANEDGSLTPDGEEGQILVTDLFNTAMPFVRYAIGDRAIAGFCECDCGRGLPLLRQVVGRELDILPLPNGQKLPGEFFPHLIKDFSSIQQFQVVQTAADHIEVKLVVDSGWHDGHRDSLRSQIVQQLGSSTKLSFKLVDEIPLTPAGKRRVVIGYKSSNLPLKTRVAG
jgi:phenylacetate-CoA ligase